MEQIMSVVNFFKDNWVAIIATYLAVHKVAVTVRDILDKTPQTDDNLFEKIVSVMGKLGAYLTTANRPK